MSWLAKKFVPQTGDKKATVAPATAKPASLGTSNRFTALVVDDEDKPAVPVSKPVSKGIYVPKVAGRRERSTFAAPAPAPALPVGPNIASMRDFPALGGKPATVAAKPVLDFSSAAKAAVDLPTPKRKPKPVEPVAPVKVSQEDMIYDRDGDDGCYWGDEEMPPAYAEYSDGEDSRDGDHGDDRDGR